MPTTTSLQRAKLDRDPITDAHVILMEFQEDGRETVHRAAINTEDVIAFGETYVATDISVTLPNSGDDIQAVLLEMSNIARIIGASLTFARSRIGVRIMLVDMSDLSAPIVDTRNILVLSQASGDSVRIRANLASRASLLEPVPHRRTTKHQFPGVWFAT